MIDRILASVLATAAAALAIYWDIDTVQAFFVFTCGLASGALMIRASVMKDLIALRKRRR